MIRIKSVIRIIVIPIFIVLFIFSVIRISNYFSIERYSKIKKNVSETDGFRNPKMMDDTLYMIKTKSNQESADFVKVFTTLLQMYQFDLQKSDINDISIKRCNRIYKEMVKSENFEEYYSSVQAVLADLRYFPVAFDGEQNYSFSFEDSFGSSRSYNGNYSHEGTDIMAGVNESGIYPIVSVSDGIVENVGWLPKGGYRIGIRGKSGGYFYYAHLQKKSITVKKGDTVKAGQRIGYMGDTGYGPEGTTGKFPVHLHFGIYIKTQNKEELSVNPYYYLRYLENYPMYLNYENKELD